MEIPEGFVLMPIIPTREILEEIVIKRYQDDSEAGRKLQHEYGLDLVPPNSEMERAVGEYERLIKHGIR